MKEKKCADLLDGLGMKEKKCADLLDGLGMKEKKCADLWAIFQLFAPPTPSRIPDVRTVKVELGPAA